METEYDKKIEETKRNACEHYNIKSKPLGKLPIGTEVWVQDTIKGNDNRTRELPQLPHQVSMRTNILAGPSSNTPLCRTLRCLNYRAYYLGGMYLYDLLYKNVSIVST